MLTEHKDEEFLRKIVESIVEFPDRIVVKRSVDEMGVLITLRVDPLDMGKLIGRMGNTAKAIRTLLRVVGMQNQSRINLKIVEPDGSDRSKISSKSVEDSYNEAKGI